MSTSPTFRQLTILLMVDVGAVRRMPGSLDTWELRGNAKPGGGQPVTATMRQLRCRSLVATNYGDRAILTAAGRAAMERRFSR